MNQSTTAATPTRRPTLGLIAQIVGIIGAVLCVLAIVGILMGRGMIQERVEVLADSAVKALDQAVVVSDEALEALTAGAADVAAVRESAESLVANPSIDELAVTALQERLAPLAQRYQEVRDRFVVMRERSTSLIDTVRRIDSLLPGIDLPDGPIDQVAFIDETLAALDQAIVALSTKAASRGAASETAQAIATGASRLEDGIGQAMTITQAIHDDLLAIEGEIDSTAVAIESLVGVVSIVVAVLLAWFGLLHVALWALGRRWRAA